MARTILHYGNEYLGTPAQIGVIPEGVIIADPDTNTIKMGDGVAVGGVNVTIQGNVAWADITGKPASLDAISGDSTDFTYNSTTNTLTVNGTVSTTTITANTYNFNGATVNNLDYSSISNKPTLFDGEWSSLSNTPTTLAGYGITDALSTSINSLQINGAIFNDLLKPGYINGLAFGSTADASPSPANDNGLAQNTDFAIASPYIYTKYIESDAKTVNFSGIAFGSNNPYISVLDESSEGKIAFVADGVVPLIATPQGIIPGDANMNIGTSGKPYNTVYANSFVGNINFNNVSNTPTTISGYGITDGQSTLVSGTNIKTVNGTSLLGSGDVTISGGATTLGALSDVNNTAPSWNNQPLVWDGTGIGEWKPAQDLAVDDLWAFTKLRLNGQGTWIEWINTLSPPFYTIKLNVTGNGLQDEVITLPNATGTVALTSDIPTIPGVIKAYAHVDVSTPITASADYNVASVTSSATGKYDVTFTNALPNANYVVSLSVQTNVDSNHYTVCYYNRTTTGFQVQKFLDGVLDSGASGNFSFVIYQA